MYLEATLQGKLVQCLASFSGALIMVCFGINNSWPLPYFPFLLSNTSTIYSTDDSIFWCSMSPSIGKIFGALFTTNLINQFGRKWSILMMTPIVFISYIIMGFAKHISLVILVRFILGTAEGTLCTLLPIYIGEIADPAIREFLTSMEIMFSIIGTLLINAVGHLMNIFRSSMVSAFIPLVQFCIFMTMPESPYWLIKTRKYEKARKSLQIFKGRETVTKQMEDLQDVIAKQEQTVQSSKCSSLFAVSNNRKACWIFLILAATNKMSDKVAIMMYTTITFQETGHISFSNKHLIAYNILELITVALTTFFIIDKFGKRLLIIISTTGCGISLLFLAIYFYLEEHHLAIIVNNNLTCLPIFILVFYTVLFSTGLGFAPVTYLSELFPLEVKGNALGLAEVIIVILEIITGLFFQKVYEQTGRISISFFWFSVGCWIGLLLIFKYVPDTRGKTLEEIQEYLTHADVKKIYSNKC